MRMAYTEPPKSAASVHARALPPGAAALAIEQQIDQVVYGLYGLTAAEVALVEASVGASRGKGGKGGGKKKGAAEAAEE